MVAVNGMADGFFHAEEACYSGRFLHAPARTDANAS